MRPSTAAGNDEEEETTAMKKDRREFRVIPFTFEKIAPGERATIEAEPLVDIWLKPSRALINRTDYDRGADFDGFEAAGKVYDKPMMVGNPTYIEGDVIPPRSKISLSIKNNGELPVYPITVVFFEVVDAVEVVEGTDR
jgi:hypothetical protein